MKTALKHAALSTLIATLCGCAGLGVATVGAIYYYTTSKNDIATVQLDARAQRVYDEAIAVIENNPDVKLVKRDDDNLLLEVTSGKLSASIKVTSLSERLTQLTIVSESSKDKEESTQMVLNGVKRICEKMNVPYTVNP